MFFGYFKLKVYTIWIFLKTKEVATYGKTNNQEKNTLSKTIEQSLKCDRHWETREIEDCWQDLQILRFPREFLHTTHASYRMRKKITLIPSTKQILWVEWKTPNQTVCPPRDLLYTGNQHYFLPHSIRSMWGNLNSQQFLLSWLSEKGLNLWVRHLFMKIFPRM